MTIRKAVLSDVQAIVDLAVKSVSNDPIPVRVDRDAMVEMARQTIGHPSHFVWVGERDGRVSSCVAGIVQKGFWFHGAQCSVVLFYADKPGDGARLLKKFAEWVKSRPSIKVAVFELEPEADPRIADFLFKLGFTRQSSNLSFVRGST